MEKVLKWIEQNKGKTILICVLLIVAPIICTHVLFKWKSGEYWIEAEWSSGDVLGYFGNVLSFIGTIGLGYVAISQTEKANKITEELLKIEKERLKPYLEILTTELYKIYLGNDMYKAYFAVDRTEKMLIELTYASQPRTGIVEDIALIELPIYNSGGSDIRQIYVETVNFYLCVSEPCPASEKFAIVMGNTCLKVDEKRTLYIYVKREYIADEDKCQQWYIDNKRDIMTHIELDLILETKSGERYLERLKCGSSWDAGMQDVEQTVTRQIGIYKNSVEKYETDN